MTHADPRELCPGCNYLTDSRVIDVEMAHQDRGIIRRRRECVLCEHRWTTYECRDRPAVIAWAKPRGRRNIVALRMAQDEIALLQRIPGRTMTDKLRNAMRAACANAA